MSSSDPVPDVEPDLSLEPKEKKAPIASPNSFFIYLAIMVGFLLYHRIAWEAVQYLAGDKIQGQLGTALFLVWLIPIAGILGSIVVPSMGTTTVWILGATIASSIPLAIAAGWTLLFGIRTSQPVSVA